MPYGEKPWVPMNQQGFAFDIFSLGWIAMNLRLRISRHYAVSDYSVRIRFSVIDLDKSNEYPANDVCILPLKPSLNANGTARNNFSKLFGHDSLQLAKRLLKQAFKTETDAEIKAEIKRRLELLEPKPPVQVKCSVCGNFFEPRWRRQKICQECRRKRYTSQKWFPKLTSIF